MTDDLDHIHFYEAVINLFAEYPCSCTSWFRSAKHNIAVGGAADSRHMDALACDIVLDEDVDYVAFKTQAIVYGLQVLDEHTHIHVQWPRTGAKAGEIRA